MDSSRRLALAKALKTRTKATVAKAGALDTPMAERNPSETPQSPNSPHTAPTTNSPYSPPQIVAVPLAVAHTSTSAPVDKGKGVLFVPSDDEGSGEGQVFKRRRTNWVISLRSASPQNGGSLPTWSIYRTSFSEIPLFTNAKSCLHFSSTFNCKNKVTLLYAGIQISWMNSLQLEECDENQIKEAFINGGRGHPPSHLKFFLLVFSKLKEDIK